MSQIYLCIGMMSLHDWYNKYNHPQTQASHIQVPVGALKGNKSGCYEECTYEDHSGSGDKRKSMSSAQPRAKHVCGHGAVTKGQSSAAKQLRISNSDKITFKWTICMIDQDGKYTLTEQGTTEQGFLACNALFLSAADCGKTKDVHLLVIENKEYVAKKLVDISHGRRQLIIEDTCKFLTADLIHLKWMSYFETKFAQCIIQEGIDTAAFQVSDGFIIKTYCYNVDQVNAELQAPICKETSKVQLIMNTCRIPHVPSSLLSDFCPTSSTPHGNHKDPLILDFLFLYFYNISWTGPRDPIKSSFFILHDMETVLTLFDPMMHTPLGKSGLGDHGFEGLHDFIDSHECSAICCSMKLCDMSAIQITLQTLEDLEADYLHTGSDNIGNESADE
ncbi:hypothetical protein BDR06DRAFT_966143 [Suillus hirtellus]|nr:hypothetical protein BDR06DRAFT_966143 [Suillus hirtellus]